MKTVILEIAVLIILLMQKETNQNKTPLQTSKSPNTLHLNSSWFVFGGGGCVLLDWVFIKLLHISNPKGYQLDWKESIYFHLTGDTV